MKMTSHAQAQTQAQAQAQGDHTENLKFLLINK